MDREDAILELDRHRCRRLRDGTGGGEEEEEGHKRLR
jgi:hypothetical protein